MLAHLGYRAIQEKLIHRYVYPLTSLKDTYILHIQRTEFIHDWTVCPVCLSVLLYRTIHTDLNRAGSYPPMS